MTQEAAESKREFIKEGQKAYEEWRASLVDTPEKRAFYQEVAAEQDLWLQLVEARLAAGIAAEEVAARMGSPVRVVKRLEKIALSYRLSTIRRYVQALGEGYSLQVRIHQGAPDAP